MIPCLSNLITMPAQLRVELTDYGKIGCRAMELWLTKIESALEAMSSQQLVELMSSTDITVPVVSGHGGLFLLDETKRRESFKLLRPRMKLAQQLGAAIVVLAGDFDEPFSGDVYRVWLAAMAEAAEMAEAHNLNLAIEFQSRASFCTNLATALNVVDDVNRSNVGICLDTFHFCTGPSRLSDIQCGAIGRILHVQVSDVSGVPRELARDSDRVLPGDGDFQIESILEVLATGKYLNHVSVELMNPQIWALPPLQVAEVALTALRRLLKQND